MDAGGVFGRAPKFACLSGGTAGAVFWPGRPYLVMGSQIRAQLLCSVWLRDKMECDGTVSSLWDGITLFSIWLVRDGINPFSVWCRNIKSGIKKRIFFFSSLYLLFRSLHS